MLGRPLPIAPLGNSSSGRCRGNSRSSLHRLRCLPLSMPRPGARPGERGLKFLSRGWLSSSASCRKAAHGRRYIAQFLQSLLQSAPRRIAAVSVWWKHEPPHPKLASEPSVAGSPVPGESIRLLCGFAESRGTVRWDQHESRQAVQFRLCVLRGESWDGWRTG